MILIFIDSLVQRGNVAVHCDLWPCRFLPRCLLRNWPIRFCLWGTFLLETNTRGWRLRQWRTDSWVREVCVCLCETPDLLISLSVSWYQSDRCIPKRRSWNRCCSGARWPTPDPPTWWWRVFQKDKASTSLPVRVCECVWVSDNRRFETWSSVKFYYCYRNVGYCYLCTFKTWGLSWEETHEHQLIVDSREQTPASKRVFQSSDQSLVLRSTWFPLPSVLFFLLT